MDTIKFKCDKCGFEKNIPSQYSGKRVRCPKCQTEKRVGQAVEQKAAPAKAVTKFNCPGCGQKMGVAAENAGKKVRCPQCKAVVTVPGPAHAVAPAKAPKTVSQVTLEEPGGDELRLSTPGMDDLLSMEKQAQSVAKLSGKPAAKRPVEEDDGKAELLRLQAKAGGRRDKQQESTGKSGGAVMAVYPIGALCSLVITVGLVMFLVIAPPQTSFAAAERFMSTFMGCGREAEDGEAATPQATAAEPNATDVNTVPSGMAEPAADEPGVGKADKGDEGESGGEKAENTASEEDASSGEKAVSSTNDEGEDNPVEAVRPGGQTRGSIAEKPGEAMRRSMQRVARERAAAEAATPYGPELVRIMGEEERNLGEYMSSHEFKDVSAGAIERMSPYLTGMSRVMSLVHSEPSLAVVRKAQCYLPDTKQYGFALTYMASRSADKDQMAVFILESTDNGYVIQGMRAKLTIFGWQEAMPDRAAHIETRTGYLDTIKKFQAMPGWYWYIGLPGGAAGVLIMLGSLWVLYEKTGRMGSSALVPVYNLWVLADVGGRPGWLSLLVTAAIVPMMLGGAMLYGGIAACMGIMLFISLGVASECGRGPLFALGLWLLPCAFYPMLVAKIEG